MTNWRIFAEALQALVVCFDDLAELKASAVVGAALLLGRCDVLEVARDQIRIGD